MATRINEMSESAFFQTAIDALVEFDIAHDHLGDRDSIANELEEVSDRLAQLEYLLGGIRDRIEERFSITERPIKMQQWLVDFASVMNQPPPPPPDLRRVWTEEELKRRVDLAFEAELFTDAFYWIAWRLREVVRRLPGLKNFDPVGIRTVRNHLLEHPERHLSATPSRELALSRRDGVILHHRVSRDADVIDEGLVPNASELRDRLTEALTRATPPAT